jgi:hypothetical protein
MEIWLVPADFQRSQSEEKLAEAKPSIGHGIQEVGRKTISQRVKTKCALTVI